MLVSGLYLLVSIVKILVIKLLNLHASHILVLDKRLPRDIAARFVKTSYILVNKAYLLVYK